MGFGLDYPTLIRNFKKENKKKMAAETPTIVEPDIKPARPTIDPKLDPDTLCPDQKKEIERIIRKNI